MAIAKNIEASAPVQTHNENGKNGVASSFNSAHPWAQLIGSMKNDPTWDEYLAIMAENRLKDQDEINALLDSEETEKAKPC